MRAGQNTIQQTLTPEAATVLNHSIAEAGRRNHGQTTPLHVAATLLSAPSGFLRQACIKSHPNSSHPLQCRALELCFSVALERLPTAAHTTTPALEPSISNALMAALKRAQAHQRRGCPEQQQQPLLAVKVELEQLIISILDDPSVSRVMREASFSSLAVKATIEQSMNSSNSNVNSSPVGLGFRPAPTGIIAGAPNRNSYLNPRLQQGTGAQSGLQRSEEVKKVVDILMRTKKTNPVLVGDSEPEAVIKELFSRIESKELNQGVLKNVEVIHLEKELVSDKAQIPGKIKELGNLVESRIANSNNGGVILDLGDLKWLVEQSGSFGVPGAVQVVSEAGRAAVAEMGKILARFREGSSCRLWLIGIATCETYMRCQIYHPTMESDLDLQALPIAARSPLPGMFPRLGTNTVLNSVEFMPPLKGFPPTTAPPRRLSENSDPARRAASCCLQCTQNYEQELAKLVAKEFKKSSSEVKSEAARPPLPQWLQNAKAQDAEVKTTGLSQAKDQESMLKQKTQELQKKWNNTCLNLHPNFHQHNLHSERIVPTPISMTGLYSQNLLGRQPFQPKLSLSKNLGATLQLNTNPVASQSPERTCSPPVCPVRTELVLGRPKLTETTTPQINHKERVQDFSSCISSESQSRFHELQSDKLTASTLDADSFKRLLKGLMEKVWWQRDAASAVAATVTQCKLGNGKQRGAGSRGHVWLLFTGPEKVGKKKMASALSELVSGANPIMISLGSRRDGRESELNFRGKTALDRISEAVRRNPFSVIMLEDIDKADMIFCGNIKRAMERGRLADSHGREVSLGNVIFILTANWLPENLKFVSNRDEEKLPNLEKGWQLKLSLCEKSLKRRPNWLHHDQDGATKPRKETASTLSFDLNEAADDAEDDRQDEVNNSSDLTSDHEDDNRRLLTASSVFRELLHSVDDTIIFKPVDFGAIRRDIKNSITKKFSTIVKDGISMEVQDDALEKILSGVWLGSNGLDEWTENVLVPSFLQLKSRMPSAISGTPNESLVVRLEPDGDSNSQSHGDWLPSSIKVVVDGL